MFETSSGTVRHDDHLPTITETQSVADCHITAIAESHAAVERNSLSFPVKLASTDAVTINMQLAAEGAAIARDMGRKAQLQFWEDLIADALYEHETGIVSHRRQAEAVLASLLHHGAIR